MREILFRVDGNSKIGLGHLYRCIALAGILKYKFSVKFITKFDTIAIPIQEANFNYVFLPENVNLLQEPIWFKENFSVDTIIVLDGYDFKENYQEQIKTFNFKLVYIDDLAIGIQKADLVINHSPGIKNHNYKAEKYTKFALGTDYAILRPLFLKAITQKREIKKIDTAFVCFGGADIHDLTLKVTLALLEINQFKKINIVIGGAYKHQKIYDIQNGINKLNIYKNLSEKELILVMQDSNFAIAPSSNILFELIAVKMPIISGYYVENQKDIYNGFLSQKAIIPIGNINNIKTQEIKEFIFSVIKDRKTLQLIKNQEKLFCSNIKENLLSVIDSLNE